MNMQIAKAEKLADKLGLSFDVEYKGDETRIVVEYASREPPEEADWVWADPPRGLGGGRVGDLLEQAGFRQEDQWVESVPVQTLDGTIEEYRDGVLYTRRDLDEAEELAEELDLRFDVEHDDDETRVVVEYTAPEQIMRTGWVWTPKPAGLGGDRVLKMLEDVGFRKKDSWAGTATLTTHGGGIVSEYREGVLYIRQDGLVDE